MAQNEHPMKNQSSIDNANHSAIPDVEWKVDKNVLIFQLSDDVIFSKVENLSKTIPFASPETGLGGLQASWGQVIVSPANGSLDTYYNLKISHRDPDANGKREDIAYLEKCIVKNKSLFRYGVGWYESAGIMGEILKKLPPHGEKKQSNSGVRGAENAGDSGWNKSETGYFITDRNLYSQIENVLKSKPAPDENQIYQNEQPWAWLHIFPALYSPAYMDKHGVKAFKVNIYKGGKINVHGVQKKGPDFESENLGWFEVKEVWNQLRLRVLEYDRKRGDDLK
jgi:hypothetical protein